ncbi:LacI family DNA-binding transcriptional regulator [Catellatospora vulcania]|uniref:LacI family DNA-binding transcriptional regulator n=1 Tax=Catellatospora vulcania TaxID=1460450 RepID=UPI0012D41E0F|nr:LacI family DNA-binding transcriptional regulator [Catellatospora vulcania]
MTGRRPTSADVAREAGVSRATVSYVLNDAPGERIAQPTRERVLAAAARLGYAPSLAGRTLANGHSDIVLLAMPDVPAGELTSRFVDAVTRSLAAQGLTLVVHFDVPAAPRLPRLAAMLSVRAVLSLFPLPDADLAALRRVGIRAVPAGTGSDGLATAALLRRQGRMQVEHLAATGHTRLAYALPADPRLSVFAGPRQDGVRQACADRELPAPVPFTVPDDPSAVTAAVRALLADAPQVTAICAYNDEVALAALHGLRELAVDVPGRIAVIGVDGIPLAAYSAPPLTTIAVAPAAAALHLARSAVARLAGERATPVPVEDVLHLIPRATT